MESRLQSNEVRIPKTTTATLSMQSPNSKRNENLNQMKISPPGVLDFDFSSPCQYFKSSFARSLSLNSGTNQTKSLDFGINFGLSRTSPIREEPIQTPVAFGNGPIKLIDNNTFNGGTDEDNNTPPPPLPLSQPPPLSNGSPSSHNSHLNISSSSSTSSSFGSTNTTTSNNSNNNNNNSSSPKNLWSTSHKQNLYRRSLDSTEIEVLRLRKECQNLIEENRRLMDLASGIVGGNLVVPGNSPNIEAVILQTQVDTLQWQLKQVEASRQMYRAVMEEVIRFLERCHRNLDSIQSEQIARSKSIHHVYRNDITNNIENNPTSPRARSSTNLMDVQKSIICPNKSNEDTSNSSPAASYNNFRDFTWRRSPKRAASAQLATSECDPEKLAQEAFRLLRTAQNLLNTQEPDLTQPKHNIEYQYNNSPLLSTTAQLTKPAQLSPATKPKSCHQQLDSDSFCLTFSRKMNMRESRLSLRSSTDGSVHSTSSSKNETDEENQTSPPICKETVIACSTTEDESGFSSISSFQEVGLPLHSTMISSPIPTLNSSTSDDSGESNIDVCIDSRNSTLKATPSSTTTATTTASQPATKTSSSSSSPLVSNNIGLPLTHNHRRWDSAPAVPPRTNIHRFSTLPTDDTPTVLWV